MLASRKTARLVRLRVDQLQSSPVQLSPRGDGRFGSSRQSNCQDDDHDPYDMDRDERGAADVQHEDRHEDRDQERQPYEHQPAHAGATGWHRALHRDQAV